VRGCGVVSRIAIDPATPVDHPCRVGGPIWQPDFDDADLSSAVTCERCQEQRPVITAAPEV
jgi:hypothetical protein